jgi:hypothetical protein
MKTDISRAAIIDRWQELETQPVKKLTFFKLLLGYNLLNRAKVQYQDFGTATQIEYQYTKGNNATGTIPTYQLDKRQSFAVAARLNITLMMAVIDRWQELESQPPKTALPPQYVRYLQHVAKVPPRHFCAMVLVYNGFIGKLSLVGHDLIEKMMPDGSFSKMFSGTLRKDGINPKTFPTYPFVSINGFRGDARAYPICFYDRADQYLQDFWLPKHAPQYLETRDRDALQKMPIAMPYIIVRFKLPQCSKQIGLF